MRPSADNEHAKDRGDYEQLTKERDAAQRAEAAEAQIRDYREVLARVVAALSMADCTIDVPQSVAERVELVVADHGKCKQRADAAEAKLGDYEKKWRDVKEVHAWKCAQLDEAWQTRRRHAERANAAEAKLDRIRAAVREASPAKMESDQVVRMFIWKWDEITAAARDDAREATP